MRRYAGDMSKAGVRGRNFSEGVGFSLEVGCLEVEEEGPAVAPLEGLDETRFGASVAGSLDTVFD